MATRPRKALVIGGGAFGLTAALELNGRGWNVTVAEATAIPAPRASSTDISKLMRMDYGADRFLTEIAGVAMAGWDAWNARWDRPLFHREGFLLLSRAPLVPGRYEFDSRATLAAAGQAVETLDKVELSRRFPAWSAEAWPHGYLNPHAGWAESAEVVRRLAADARLAGVHVSENTPIATLVERGSRVVGAVTESGRVLRAHTIVVAAGAWTPTLVPELHGALTPVGQPVLHFSVSDPRRWQAPRFTPWAADISQTGWYGFTATAEGILKIGHHGLGLGVPLEPHASVPDAHVSRCRGFLLESLPELADAPLVGSRVCYYCDSFDGYLWIGRDPNRRGLVVAAGGSGHGFKFAPILGPLIADAVEGTPSRWSAPFDWRVFEGPIRTEDARYLGE